jgi:hypothetical protein
MFELAMVQGHRDVPGTNYPQAMIYSLTTVVNTCLTIPQNVKPKMVPFNGGTMILWVPKGICFRLILHLKEKHFSIFPVWGCSPWGFPRIFPSILHWRL